MKLGLFGIGAHRLIALLPQDEGRALDALEAMAVWCAAG